MIRHHDRWSKLGEEYLGEHNIDWARRMEEFPTGIPGSGPLTLMKSIINDYWADVPGATQDWDAMKVDEVMAKIYWCWVAWLDATHMEVEEE
tara:strand:+ start:267 stop:542 length:276 start_codon:yes stop_codon:yes gene_type:complete